MHIWYIMNSFLPAGRRFPIGAEVLPDRSGVLFRVWAPKRESIELIISADNDSLKKEIPSSIIMEKDSAGYFTGKLSFFFEGLLYGFRLDGKEYSFPDPATRFQPFGPQGLSEVIDSTAYHWNDSDWRGIPEDGKVLYEMHVGTFTSEGTWESAQRQLEELANLGITVIELLPIAEFYGKFDWGYNGIFQFAPSHTYGFPDSFRSFVDTAHQCGIGVILDVVYNHLGNGSEIFNEFSPYYFTRKYRNEWGAAISFDDIHSGPVREYFLTNAAYWIEEFHLDGYRIDATQQIFDESPVNIISEIVKTVHGSANGRRPFIVAENENQDVVLYHRHKIDAVWSDDFHRSSTVALTGRAEAYYSDYRGTPQEFVSACKYGYLYQGQYYTWQKKCRGTPAIGLKKQYFIHYLQNHDQVANSLRGLRIHAIADPALYRAFTLLLLLGPQIPLLFQGQEFCSSAPFYFFTDKKPEVVLRAARGRKKFLSQFESIVACDGPFVPDPGDTEAFERCKLDFSERQIHSSDYLFHRELLFIRRNEQVFRSSGLKGVDGAVLDNNVFLLRYFGINPRDDRLLIMNMGTDIGLNPNPEPLFAPPCNCEWKIIINSEDPKYGGSGAPSLQMKGIPKIAGHSALFFGADYII